ncbi:Thioredoxin-like_fold domain-containing protein [Pseudozyma hubeiensis]|nr:Thioredoxin-like_fold domain-containing protein [Pseudozyma hubeiensis]
MTELRPGSTPKRTVSFGPSDTVTLTTSDMTTTNNVNGASADAALSSSSSASSSGEPSTPRGSTNPSPPTSVLKSAMKAGADHKRLPPPTQYQHPDPLLRRLRLVDPHGVPVNLRSTFRDTKVVGFYFASQWAGQPLKEYHSAISDFCRRHPHEFKAIYVSVDVDEQWYKAGVKDKPWISMVWNDGSSMPAERQDRTTSVNQNGDMDELPRLYNNEDFLLANEQDIDESLSHTDKSGEAYLRPFSRVHLAAKLNIIAAPTLCIYHVESGRMLEWNVRMGRLSSNRRDETWEKWRMGESSRTWGVREAFQVAPYTVLVGVAALLYWLWVRWMGEEWNVLRRTLHSVLEGRMDGGLEVVKRATGDEL